MSALATGTVADRPIIPSNFDAAFLDANKESSRDRSTRFAWGCHFFNEFLPPERRQRARCSTDSAIGSSLHLSALALFLNRQSAKM
jgi:hypothetical protein